MEKTQSQIKQVNIGLGKRINASKEFQEQTRLRKSFERKLRSQMIVYFGKLYNKVADSYEIIEPYDQVLKDSQNDLYKILNSHYRVVIQKFGERQLRNYQKQNIFEEIYQDYVRQVGATRVVAIQNSTRNIIKRVINANIDEGVEVIGKKIRDQGKPFNSFNRYRSNTIARTETHNAASYANHKVVESLNIPDVQKRWTTTLDPRSRATHVQANGQTVGMDEDFTVGGRPMAYPGDPRGGAANVINCRCVLIYVTPEDVVTDDTTTTPRPRQARDTQEVSLEKLLSSPRNASFTHETFNIGKRAVIIKSLDDRAKLSKREYEEFFENPDFINVYGDRFRKSFKSDKLFENKWSRTQSINRKRTKIELSDEALSIVEQSMKEVDELAKRFKIPRINSITIGVSNRAGASIGDGQLFLNAQVFNQRAKQTSKVSPNKLTQQEREELRILNTELEELKKDFQKHYTKRPEFDFKSEEYQNWYNTFRKKDKSVRALELQMAPLKEKEGFKKFEVSTFKLGQKKEMPTQVKKYHDNGLDQIRSTIYHEFGHHVHQTVGLQKAVSVNRFTGNYQTSRSVSAIPIERELKEDFGTRKKRNATDLPSDYANANEKEFFAENFANYFMGKKELVSPKAKILIERIMREQNDIK
jgi:hypothetical protein